MRTIEKFAYHIQLLPLVLFILQLFSIKEQRPEGKTVTIFQRELFNSLSYINIINIRMYESFQNKKYHILFSTA